MEDYFTNECEFLVWVKVASSHEGLWSEKTNNILSQRPFPYTSNYHWEKDSKKVEVEN